MEVITNKPKIAIIGGGAAGFFAALSAKEHFPEAQVTIYEKSNKVLAKVKISGGGRCNVTHACYDNVALSKFYPRGEKQLRRAFEQFNTRSTVDWFKKRGVLLETLPDNCIFPKSNTSQTIIDCFENETRKLGIKVLIQTSINRIQMIDNQKFKLISTEQEFTVDRLVITTGGTPKLSGMDWIAALGHQIVEPLPSLYTFNMPGNPVCELMGIVNENTRVRIESTKLVADGPLLITHWGMSGPAILKLSAWGARILAEKQYKFNALVNWLHTQKDFEASEILERFAAENAEKLVSTYNPFGLSKRLWLFLVNKSEIHEETRWKNLGRKTFNKLVNTLVNDSYPVNGKTTFKEEFVTAGGVDLSQIDFNTMQSKVVSGLYFAGEILDIDGITGGFNFQAAWTTGWIAGKNCGV
ncbi:MAG: NAD(P)/FAD-dependent oxidoreductase [Bacteroidota bacterium]